MTTTDIIILNFEEIRRRSIKLWSAIPHENIHWKPDVGAFSIIEMVRHVLEGEHLYHKIIENGALDEYLSPWKTRRYEGIDEEIEFAKPYREAFLSYIKNIAASDLKNVWVERKEVNQKRKLGDYLLRVAYHESVHTGQMLGYLRSSGLARPKIWD